MSRRNCSFLITSLLPALALASLCAGANAEEAKVPQAQPMRWSDPATWPNHKVPVAGDKPTISKDKDVVLDVSPPPLDGLSIDGKLSFSDDTDLELTTEWIMLHGELAIGSEGHPHTRKATITLTDHVKGEDVMGGMGDRGIMLSGGTLNLHGSTTNSWSKLSVTAKAGATSIQVLDARGGRWAMKSSSPRPILIHGRRSAAALPPSASTTSHWSGSSTSCTSARSPSTWMNAAKWAC